MTRQAHEGLAHVAASGATLSLLMDDRTAVHLAGVELDRILDEIAMAAPERLHSALERRLVAMIAREVRCDHA